MAGDQSARLIRALQSPGAFPHPVSSVQLLETHISWVLLTGEFAYKIKKPVDLGFVNFSTLERRRFCCDEEIRLNRRLAPKLYLGVAPIAGTVDAPRVGGPGDAIEYCVQMKQFPQEALLNRLAAEGKLLPRHVDALSREVAQFHARIPAADPAGPFGTPELVAEPIRANFASLEGAEPASGRALIAFLRGWCEQQLEAHRETFAARKRNGFIRECHGDMHLGNMLLEGDEVVIFDCIEFNESLRWIDVMSEVAFCTMDLEDRGRPDLARRFLNGCLEWSGDYAGLSLFPLYFVYRALVRAKVARLRLAQESLPRDQRAETERELGNYLELANRSTHRARPILAVTFGVSGSGKSRGALSAVERLGLVRLRSDVERKRLAGLDPLAQSQSALSAGLYSEDVTRRTYARLAELAGTVLDAGMGTVVDATFLRRADRECLRRVAEQRNVPFFILRFDADAELCRARIRRRQQQSGDPSEATEEVLDRQLSAVELLSEEERASAITVDAAADDGVERALVEWERRLSGT